LSSASEDSVLSQWAGLGYYARARNLHQAARLVVDQHGGVWPADLASLTALPGIGRSTAGAILSLSLNVRAPILDGNVKRVLSRYAAVTGWPGAASTLSELWDLSESLTPAVRFAEYTQAMMDLGATLCTRRNPACPRCPLREGCLAKRFELTAQLPTPKPKKRLPVRTSWMLVLRDGEGGFYLEKRPPVGIWGGLWSFPQFDDPAEAKAWCQVRGIADGLEAWPLRRHTFSHYHLDFTPLFGQLSNPARRNGQIAEPNAAWFKPQQASALPTPVRRLMWEIADAGPLRPDAAVD
jgi:A/G-specific adenine glycosylase